MSYTAPTRTVGEIFQAVKRQFGDESGVQLADSDIIGWINDAQTVIVTKNKILKAKSTAPSIVGQKTYSFPALPIYQIESLHYKGHRVINVPFAEAENRIFGRDPDNVQTGVPEIWYEWAGEFTFWPTPDTVESIDIYYTAKPTPVANSDDFMSVPDKYYQDIVRYVLQQAYEMDEDWQASQTKSDQFTASINEMGEEERTAQNMTYDTITVYDS